MEGRNPFPHYQSKFFVPWPLRGNQARNIPNNLPQTPSDSDQPSDGNSPATAAITPYKPDFIDYPPPRSVTVTRDETNDDGGPQVPLRPGASRFGMAFPAAYIRPLNRPPVVHAGHSTANDDGFVPMSQWPARYNIRDIHPAILDAQLRATGISGNYGGNIFLPENQSADIPEVLSTSLWLTNLPPTCTHQMLLGAIRGCGKIYAAVINPPENPVVLGAQGTPHTTSASKLVFFDRSGVDKLLVKSQAGEFSVDGYVPRVRMNRIKSKPRTPGPQCRVLHIEGPAAIVNERYLNWFFQSKFNYELEAILTLDNLQTAQGPYRRQEWRFGSFRCQADSARQSIAREKARANLPDDQRELWAKVLVHFGVDPCA
ncbi:hypothetical protein GGR54DRAFT_644484 [Hypoxylon sp. NC1633]|nr:hypothetical protein GGR54DRAFT_644484 [Hypoxylon sp. NC1633]